MCISVYLVRACLYHLYCIVHRMVKCTASVGKCWEARSFKLALAISCIVFVAVIVVVIVIFLVTLISEFCSSTLGHYLLQVSFSSETFLEVMCVGITIIPVFIAHKEN